MKILQGEDFVWQAEAFLKSVSWNLEPNKEPYGKRIVKNSIEKALA